MTDTFNDAQVIAEMKRIHDLRQEKWNHEKLRLPLYQGKNVPTPYVPAPYEDRREEAITSLRAKQARIGVEAQQDTDMWYSRFGLKGGYRKSRRSRTLKRVQKRKQTRRHRHRHRR
jgi:hypothetical protein